MPDSILCAIDFSDSSFRAMQWAIDQAQQNHYHLHILYAYRLKTAAQENAFQLKQKMEDTAHEKFAELEREKLINKTLNYDFLTEVGFLEDRLADRISRNSVKLVVLTKEMCKGKENLDEILNSVRVPIVIVS